MLATYGRLRPRVIRALAALESNHPAEPHYYLPLVGVDPEWQGGYFCPCHKSKFDMAGRVFQGVPAPTNLVVPPHFYENDATLVIGLDPQGAA